MSRKFIFYLLLLSLVGCASPINRKNAEIYTRQGTLAIALNDWQAARRAFAKAVVNAELGNVPPSTRAVLNYEYGRSLGVTCFFDDAEYYLEQAYKLDKETGGPIYLSLVELARLHLDQRNFATSTSYFKQALIELELFDIPETGPIGYADVLDETAIALAAINQTDEASQMKLRSQEIRLKHPNKRSITDRTPYGKYCG